MLKTAVSSWVRLNREYLQLEKLRHWNCLRLKILKLNVKYSGFVENEYVEIAVVEKQPRIYKSYGNAKTSLVNATIETASIQWFKLRNISVMPANFREWQSRFEIKGKDKSVQYYLDKNFPFIKNQQLLRDHHQWDATLIALFI